MVASKHERSIKYIVPSTKIMSTGETITAAVDPWHLKVKK